MKTLLTLGTCALGGAAILLGQMTAVAGGKGGDGGVAGGSTDCATAPALVLGDNAFDTSGSGVSLAVPAVTGCSAHTMYKVNYFTFTPVTTGNHTFSTCTGTAWDSRLLIMSTCTPTSGVLNCNDDSCGLQSSMTASLNAGTTYRVVVGGFGSTNGGAGVLNVVEGGTGGGGGGGGTGVVGPDVIVGAIPDISKYGSVVVNGQTIMAYSIGTTSCNIGDELLDWFAQPDNRHPFITQNIYRIKGGRIEHIGMGWGKHGFTALQGTLCGACQAASSGTWLGIGCSDPYSSGLNGSQSGLGTRTEVNAATGVFPGTYNTGMPAAPATIGRRIQVNGNDLNPALNAGATYLVEGQYIHSGDAARGNDNNNASWRSVTVGALTSGAYTLTLGTAATVQQQPAITAWRAADAAVTLVNADVPSDGRFILGYKVSQNTNGTWHYEYAVQNLNSDRSGQSFRVPVPTGVAVTNVYFHDVDYHSGDAYVLTDWTSTTTGGAVTWAGGTFAQNSNNNALRFSTLYNFAFDASTAPVAGNATIGLFKPGAAGAANSIDIATLVPSGPSNPADLNGDGTVNGADLAALLGNWGGTGSSDINGDGTTNAADLALLLSAWSA